MSGLKVVIRPLFALADFESEKETGVVVCESVEYTFVGKSAETVESLVKVIVLETIVEKLSVKNSM